MEIILLGLLWQGVVAATAAVTRACCTCPGPDVVTRPEVVWPPDMGWPGDTTPRRTWGPLIFTQAEFAAFAQHLRAYQHHLSGDTAVASEARSSLKGCGPVEGILDRAQERARELARKAAKKGAR